MLKDSLEIMFYTKNTPAPSSTDEGNENMPRDHTNVRSSSEDSYSTDDEEQEKVEAPSITDGKVKQLEKKLVQAQTNYDKAIEAESNVSVEVAVIN